MSSEATDLPLTQEQTPTSTPASGVPHGSPLSVVNQLLFGDPNSFAPILLICRTILYSEMFPSVITNLVSPPPPLPRGIVGFN